ncbi:MAG: helix-turn-helix domain-containing protein [Clostridia bacterium]|nr:helix-turn-helix domain-containing protein [Clostridia bacterium]
MTTGEKLASLRKQNNYTQEQLAMLLDVSRQSVSKWESNLAYPETEKLIRLSKLYNCSVDYLLHDDLEHDPMTPVLQEEPAPRFQFTVRSSFGEIEKQSRTMVGNLPLWHVCFKRGKVARGVFAAGFRAKGVFTFGLLSQGLFSFGVLSMGLISFGVLSMGLLALGSIALGLIALGAIAVGVMAVGAVAVGLFSVGALAIAKYAALGDVAKAAIAAGVSTTEGSLLSCDGSFTPEALQQLDMIVPDWLGWAKKLFALLVG